jgi:hypothetical protein
LESYLIVRLARQDKADLFDYARQHQTTASEIVRQLIRGSVRQRSTAKNQSMKSTVSLVDKVNLYTVVLADESISATAKVIAGWLLFFHHNTSTGQCFPSNRTIGLGIGLRPENVSRHIRALVGAGYLLVQRRFGTSNSYGFNWSKGSRSEVSALRKRLKSMSGDSTDMPKSSLLRDEISKTPCSNRQDGNDEIVNLIREGKTVIEDGNLTLCGEIYGPLSTFDGKDSPEDLQTRVAHLDDEFVSRFCSVYPLIISENRGPALRAALKRALIIAHPDAILDGAMRYAIECSAREAHHIADPVNWLNGKRWQSETKTKSETVILGADGNPITANHSRPLTRQQQISQWKPASKNPFSLQ